MVWLIVLSVYKGEKKEKRNCVFQFLGENTFITGKQKDFKGAKFPTRSPGKGRFVVW
jgi:hypothetical protein